MLVRYTFIQPASFSSDWARLGLTDDDLRALENEVMARPDAGAVMAGTGGLRKVRYAPPSWRTGKSGALRVCYVVFPNFGVCYLVALFPKNERANLSAADKAMWRRWITQRRKELGDEG